MAQTRRWIREGLRWLAATAATLLVSTVLVLLHSHASTAGILYLALVVWFATVAGREVSLYLALISAILFDYYFLAPRYSFDISGTQSWFTMVAFVASCFIVGRVAERARRQTRSAEQRREDVERLYALGQEMMLHEDAAGLVREIPRLVQRNFALQAVLLYIREEDQLYSSVSVYSPTMLATLRTASATWEPNTELPEGFAPMNLVFGMNSVGTLAWKPPTLSHEVATSIAAQVAIAITRAHAIEVSSRLEAARAADRLRNALIDSLTHELRTPLTAIRAAATTLTSATAGGYVLDEETRTELNTIVVEESSRLDSLIGEAMEVAEIEADGIRVKPEPLHTATFLEQAVEQSRDQLGSRRVIITAEQPDTPVWFDPHLIGRVLRHLLENAARYTPPNSRIVLQCRRTPGRLEFLVEDDGPGIDPQDLPLIFEKFYRGKYRTTSAKGSGMGLAITRALLAAHGGSIEAESVSGHGSTFRFWIPTVEKSTPSTTEAMQPSLPA